MNEALPTDFYDPAPFFTDRRNITVGSARLIWVKASGIHPEGWVLPGGSRITDRGRAMQLAAQMSVLMAGSRPRF